MKLPIALIIKGHVKEALGLEKDLSGTRLDICKKCPLYSYSMGGVCNSRLWLNVETGDVSSTKRPGYKNGCGCLLISKTRRIESHCPIDKW